MSYQLIEKSGWQAFFDGISKTLGGKHVEIEVMGLDLGVQVQVQWLPINGITYDPNDDTLYIFIEGVDRDLDHAIPSPREIYFEVERGGLVQIVVMDGEHKQIVRFRAPLELSPYIDESLGERAPAP